MDGNIQINESIDGTRLVRSLTEQQKEQLIKASSYFSSNADTLIKRKTKIMRSIQTLEIKTKDARGRKPKVMINQRMTIFNEYDFIYDLPHITKELLEACCAACTTGVKSLSSVKLFHVLKFCENISTVSVSRVLCVDERSAQRYAQAARLVNILYDGLHEDLFPTQYKSNQEDNYEDQLLETISEGYEELQDDILNRKYTKFISDTV